MQTACYYKTVDHPIGPHSIPLPGKDEQMKEYFQSLSSKPESQGFALCSFRVGGVIWQVYCRQGEELFFAPRSFKHLLPSEVHLAMCNIAHIAIHLIIWQVYCMQGNRLPPIPLQLTNRSFIIFWLDQSKCVATSWWLSSTYCQMSRVKCQVKKIFPAWQSACDLLVSDWKGRKWWLFNEIINWTNLRKRHCKDLGLCHQRWEWIRPDEKVGRAEN